MWLHSTERAGHWPRLCLPSSSFALFRTRQAKPGRGNIEKSTIGPQQVVRDKRQFARVSQRDDPRRYAPRLMRLTRRDNSARLARGKSISRVASIAVTEYITL